MTADTTTRVDWQHGEVHAGYYEHIEISNDGETLNLYQEDDMVSTQSHLVSDLAEQIDTVAGSRYRQRIEAEVIDRDRGFFERNFINDIEQYFKANSGIAGAMASQPNLSKDWLEGFRFARRMIEKCIDHAKEQQQANRVQSATDAASQHTIQEGARDE